MSSEIAYFPDAFARVAEVRDEACDGADIQTDVQWEEPLEPTTNAARLSEVSDERLLEQVREGVKESVGTLFRRHSRAVRSVALRILRDEAEAEDLVQEVFLHIFRKAGLYNPAQGRAVTWILHVAYHRAFDRRRRLNARHFYSTLELDEAGRHLADSAGPIAGEQSLREALGKGWMEQVNILLTPEQRETIELFLKGYALKEIAERTGRSLVNVRSYYYRGLERLRKHFLGEKTRSR